MQKPQKTNKLSMVYGKWEWQTQKLKERFGQLFFKDEKSGDVKESNFLSRIGNRLNKTFPLTMTALKKRKPS